MAKSLFSPYQILFYILNAITAWAVYEVQQLALRGKISEIKAALSTIAISLLLNAISFFMIIFFNVPFALTGLLVIMSLFLGTRMFTYAHVMYEVRYYANIIKSNIPSEKKERILDQITPKVH